MTALTTETLCGSCPAARAGHFAPDPNALPWRATCSAMPCGGRPAPAGPNYDAGGRLDFRESIHRIRHYLAHAAMGLQSVEAEARRGLGNAAFEEVALCLTRSRQAIDDWLHRQHPPV